MLFSLDSPGVREYVVPMQRVDTVRVEIVDPVTGRITYRQDNVLVEIPGGMAVMPYNPTFSVITPEGEAGEITWIAFAYKTLPLSITSNLQDAAGKKYAVKVFKEWADYYELGLN